MTKRKPGRPTKLIPEITEKLTQAIRLGATYEHACKFAGVDYTTVRKWIAQGKEEGSGPFFDFFNTIENAEGKAVVRWLSVMEEDVNAGNAQTAAKKLAMRYPNDYGRQVSEVNHHFNPSELTDEELVKIANGG